MTSDLPPDTSSEILPANETVPPSAGSGEAAPALTSVPPPDIGSELSPATTSAPPSAGGENLPAPGSPSTPVVNFDPPSPRHRRSSWPLLIRLAAEGVLGACLVGFLVFSSVDRWQQAN